MMAESQKPAIAPNKVALSRALGAAFLNHQVEQLEKSVAGGPGSGNWRDRRQAATAATPTSPGHGGGNNARGIISVQPKRSQQQQQQKTTPTKKKVGDTRNGDLKPAFAGNDLQQRKAGDKDADIVIVDASVLVHAIHQVKLWCRSDRKEHVIIPLEALNTLDLLKKGTSVLAQRARAASRILESQVGVNNRIIVQSDDAFVPWDKIAFSQDASSTPLPQASTSPEWVRRVICCAQYEVKKGAEEKKRVVLAISPLTATSHIQYYSKTDSETSAPLSPVPLPAPHHKYEPRSAGILVAQWAQAAGVEIMDVKPTATMTADEEPDKARRGGRKYSHSPGNADAGLVKRPPAVLAMMEMISQPNKAVRVLARGEKLDPDP